MSLKKYYVFQGMRQGAKNRAQRKALNKASQVNFIQKRIDRNVTIISRLDQRENPVLFKQLTDSINKDNDTLEALIGIPKLKPTTEGDKVDKKDSSKTVIADVGKKKLKKEQPKNVLEQAVGPNVGGFLAKYVNPIDYALGFFPETQAKFESVIQREAKQFREDPKGFFQDIVDDFNLPENVRARQRNANIIASGLTYGVSSGDVPPSKFGSEIIKDIFNFGKRIFNPDPTIIAKEKTENDQGDPLEPFRLNKTE